MGKQSPCILQTLVFSMELTHRVGCSPLAVQGTEESEPQPFDIVGRCLSLPGPVVWPFSASLKVGSVSTSRVS